MKKLAIVFLSVAFTGGIAFACPHEDAKAAEDNAPKTADKAKPAEKPAAKEADKARTAKPTKAEDKKDEKKPADKVSQK